MFRKVKARVWFSNKKEWEVIVGKFHQWGASYEEFRDSPVGNFTLAIIELEDGSIVTALPSDVRFID